MKEKRETQSNELVKPQMADAKQYPQIFIYVVFSTFYFLQDFLFSFSTMLDSGR